MVDGGKDGVNSQGVAWREVSVSENPMVLFLFLFLASDGEGLRLRLPEGCPLSLGDRGTLPTRPRRGRSGW